MDKLWTENVVNGILEILFCVVIKQKEPSKYIQITSPIVKYRETVKTKRIKKNCFNFICFRQFYTLTSLSVEAISET